MDLSALKDFAEEGDVAFRDDLGDLNGKGSWTSLERQMCLDERADLVRY